MGLSKKKKLVSSFFKSQFNYHPLIWMFHSGIINNKINRLHERCLRLLYEDKSSSSEKLLKQDKSVTIHNRNLQIFAMEFFKVYQNISPLIFSEIFRRRRRQPGKSGPKKEVYCECCAKWHTEQVKFVNHKYDMINDLWKRLFTSILQNS